MGFCPANCQNTTLVPNPTGGCVFDTRNVAINRVAFMICGIELPDPFTAANTAPLFADGSIIASSPLANVVWADPETEDVLVHDCLPAQKYVTKRTLTFEDRIALQITSGSPATTNKFADYDFWKDKLEHRLLLRYGLIYCNGDFKFARNPDGTLMEGYFNMILSGQRLNNNGGTIELKKGSIDFFKDPLDLTPPDFNLVEFNIEL